MSREPPDPRRVLDSLVVVLAELRRIAAEHPPLMDELRRLAAQRPNQELLVGVLDAAARHEEARPPPWG